MPQYDAFVSYSHALDKPIAAALQSVVQRLGKAWHQRRALRLFRDDTSLSATPHLWPSIEIALGQSRFLVLLASPEAAASPWVDRELAWWLDHKGSETVLIALTAGELRWDERAGDFARSETHPLPPALAHRFEAEPLWIDLRDYRERAAPRDVAFADRAAAIAAAIRGMPKEDLLSQEVRQQRRALRLAWSGVGTLVVLLALAGWQWIRAETQRARAERSLALATDTANGLVFNLADQFRDLGLPAATVGDILSRARKLQEQLVAGGETAPRLRYSQAVALSEASQTLLVLGDTQAALADAQQAQTIVARLAAAQPQVIDFQRQLAIGEDQIGDVLQAQGDLAGALARYRASLSIRQAVAAKNVEKPLLQHDLATSNDKIADVLESQGDLAGALALYRDTVAIATKLSAKEPANTEWQRDLAVSDGQVGNILLAQGDLVGALAAHRDSRAIMQALAKKEPNNTEWQNRLAAANQRVGDVLRAQDDLPGALAAYSDDVTISRALAASDPNNAEWQLDLSFSDSIVGDVLRAQGNLAGALTAYRDAQSVRAGLIRKDATNTEWQRVLSISDDKIGNVLQDQGNLDDALAAFREALEIRKALTQKDPTNTQWLRDLSVSYDKIGVALGLQDDLPGIVAAYRESLAIAKTLAAKDVTNTEWQRDLAVSEIKLGEVLTQQGDAEGALDLLRAGVAVEKGLADKQPQNPKWPREMVGGMERIGAVQVAQNDFAGAEESYRASMTIRQTLAKDGKSGSRRDLAATMGNLCWVLLLTRKTDDALATIEQAVKLDADAVWLDIDRAHALLLVGRADEASAIYQARRDTDLGENQTGVDMVKDDFRDLRQHGIDTPAMKEVEALLAK